MKKMGMAGLALVVAGAVIFGAGFIGARGDLSTVNGSLGPISVQLPATGGAKTTGGIGGGRGKPMTTPMPTTRPASTAPVSTDSGRHDEHEYERDGHEEQHHADSADCRSFPCEDVRAVELKIARADVTLLPSSDGTVSLSCDSLDDYRVSLDKSGTLSVESRGKITVFGLNLTGERPTLTVTLPGELCCPLEAEVDCGNISVERLSLGEVELDTDLGDVYMKNIECRNAELSSSSGSVHALNVASSGALDAETDLGDVILESSQAGGKLSAESSCGKVTVTDCTAADAEISSDLGDVTVHYLTCERTAKLDCDCGAISFNGLLARSIEIDNSMGSIEGTLPGSISDYSIESGTDLGSNNLPSKLELGNIKLKVHDSCGSIDIGFEKD